MRLRDYAYIKSLTAIVPILFLISELTDDSLQWIDDPGKSKAHMQEICDNAIDDDGDLLVDLNDSDCVCLVIEPTSLIPNPSFEEMHCCPGNRSQLDCADTWIQASEPTTDYIHTCGWLGWPQFPPPMPFPEGDAIVGFRDGRVIQGQADLNWKEYSGACLLSPLEAGERYRFEFHLGFSDPVSSPPINITFFGTTNCDNLPFGVGDDSFGCPTNGPGWVRLGSRLVSGFGGNEWIKTSIDVTPNDDITAIAIGPSCQGIQSTTSLYYFFDNLVLDDQRSFEFQIKEVGHLCNLDFILELPEEVDLNYQWYKEGIALIGETDHAIRKMYGEGRYQVRVSGDLGCNVTKVYDYVIPSESNTIDKIICHDDVFIFGTRFLDRTGSYIDTFKTSQNCDSIVSLNLKVLGIQADTVNAKIFDGEKFKIGDQKFAEKGSHLATLQSGLGCDSLVYLNLDYYKIFIPNIFSPNRDHQNDQFTISGQSDLLEVSNMTILDKWGTELFNGNNLFANESKGWDGRKNGKYVDPGLYIYVVRIMMDDGIERQFAGDVLVVN